jgi:hypothetical protein
MGGERVDAWNSGQIHPEDAVQMPAQIEPHLVASYASEQRTCWHLISCDELCL